jgi:hypothetical protein
MKRIRTKRLLHWAHRRARKEGFAGGVKRLGPWVCALFRGKGWRCWMLEHEDMTLGGQRTEHHGSGLGSDGLRMLHSRFLLSTEISELFVQVGFAY